MTDTTDQSTDLTRMFAPIERALLEAFALRTGAPKALASLRPLVHLAYLALAQAFGLAHLITPSMRALAVDAARRPGRRKTEFSGQMLFLELLPIHDGRPGVYVSFARLKLGNVLDRQGDDLLDLTGITEVDTALVRAYEQGWIGGPSGNGLRFVPPTVWGLVVDHNSAGFARKGGVDEYIESLSSELKTAHERIEVLEKSIAASARLPITEPTKESCHHKGVMLFDGKRTCTACNEVLPELPNEKTARFRKKAHAALTANEEPREPLPSKAGTAKGSRTKASKKPAKAARKGRAS